MRARIYGVICGDANVNEYGGKRSGFSAGLKQLNIAKRKVKLKGKKHENVELKEEDVPGAILPRNAP